MIDHSVKMNNVYLKWNMKLKKKKKFMKKSQDQKHSKVNKILQLHIQE